MASQCSKQSAGNQADKLLHLLTLGTGQSTSLVLQGNGAVMAHRDIERSEITADEAYINW